MEIKYSDDAKLVINITDEMVGDYRCCEQAAGIIRGPGKDCRTCSLGTTIIEDYSLCDLPVVKEELERRIHGWKRR